MKMTKGIEEVETGDRVLFRYSEVDRRCLVDGRKSVNGSVELTGRVVRDDGSLGGRVYVRRFGFVGLA